MTIGYGKFGATARLNHPTARRRVGFIPGYIFLYYFIPALPIVVLLHPCLVLFILNQTASSFSTSSVCDTRSAGAIPRLQKSSLIGHSEIGQIRSNRCTRVAFIHSCTPHSDIVYVAVICIPGQPSRPPASNKREEFGLRPELRRARGSNVNGVTISKPSAMPGTFDFDPSPLHYRH